MRGKMNRYALTLITAPTTEPFTLAEAKAHLKIDGSNAELAPTAPTVALAGAGAGNVNSGAHRYLVTFVTADGETEAGAVSAAVTTTAGDGRVSVSAIPTGGSAVTSRKIYRTAANGSTYLLLTTLSDNTTTTYADNIADGSLGAAAPSSNTTVDPYLTAVIKTARQAAEIRTGRRFITQTWDMRMDRFPAVIEVPYPPLVSVSSISYNDSNGDSQTLSSSLYTVDIYREPARIVPAYSQVWPTTRGHLNDVTVRFVCGYGAASDVLEQLKAGMKIIMTHLYENRGTDMGEIPPAAKALLDPYAIWSFS